MSDIFVSYSSRDEERVARLVEILERAGTVWWAREIPHGSRWRATIQQALDLSRCVVVVWSRNSVDSDWVYDEASAGYQREILVPVVLDDARIPPPFGQVETARLQGWDGSDRHPEIEMLLRSVAGVLAANPRGAPAPEPRRDPGGAATPPTGMPSVPGREGRPAIRGGPGAGWLAAGAAVVLLGGYAGYQALLPDRGPDDAGTARPGAEAQVPDGKSPGQVATPRSPDEKAPAGGGTQPATERESRAPVTQTPAELRVQAIIVSETQTPTLKAAVDFLSGDEQRRGYHYLVDVDGKAHAFFDEQQIARHTARYSQTSLGIGMVHMVPSAARSFGRAYAPYSDAQIDGLVVLLADLAHDHRVSVRDIKAKCEIDPRRDCDIGEQMTDIRIRVGALLAERRGRE